MGTQLLLVSITEVKGHKRNLSLKSKLKQLELTDMLGDILVYKFKVKSNSYNKYHIDIGKSMNDTHSFKCSKDQTLAEVLEFETDLKIVDITLKCKDCNKFMVEEDTNKKDEFQLLMDSARASNTPKKR